jgi:hypothetical protein
MLIAQAASRQYGVNILASGETFDLFSLGVQKLCRRVDRVTVKGSLQPMDLWTYDTNQMAALTPLLLQTLPKTFNNITDSSAFWTLVGGGLKDIIVLTMDSNIQIFVHINF